LIALKVGYGNRIKRPVGDAEDLILGRWRPAVGLTNPKTEE